MDIQKFGQALLVCLPLIAAGANPANAAQPQPSVEAAGVTGMVGARAALYRALERRYRAPAPWSRGSVGSLVPSLEGSGVVGYQTGPGDLAGGVNTRAYPRNTVVVDPLVWIEQRVTASSGAASDDLGWSVALDGTNAVIGAPSVNVNTTPAQFGVGAAYVFSQAAGAWTQSQKLAPSDSATANVFGASVAIYGNTAFVGAFGANSAQGAVYVFTKSGGTWAQTQKITANDGVPGDEFGDDVVTDGTTLLVGAIFANGGAGAVYVYTNSSGTWVQTQKLTASDAAYDDWFGFSIALQGTMAIVGAPFADVSGNADEGAAYVLAPSGATWSQAQKLTPTDGTALDLFGWSVSMGQSAALVGQPGPGPNLLSPGAAYAFTESGGAWTQTQKLTVSGVTTPNEFGIAVSLDGTQALIGADIADVGGVYQGAAYRFTNSGGTWNQGVRLTARDGALGDVFGASTTLQGSTAVIGAPGRDVGGNVDQGAAYFYGNTNLTLTVSAPSAATRNTSYAVQAIVTNAGSTDSPAITVNVTVPKGTTFVSASATPGSCSQTSGIVACAVGTIVANGGTAAVNVTLKATGSSGTVITNSASIN